MTIVAVVFLLFVYFFDWTIHGQSKFTLTKGANKAESTSRLLPGNEATLCGAQDLNTRLKLRFDDSYFVVDTTQTNFWSLCLDKKNFVNDSTSSKITFHSLQLGNSNVLLKRPIKQSVQNEDQRHASSKKQELNNNFITSKKVK